MSITPEVPVQADIQAEIHIWYEQLALFILTVCTFVWSSALLGVCVFRTLPSHAQSCRGSEVE